MLRDGFWPRYCLEDVAWLGYDAYDYIAYPMVCFCEIPLSRITEHVAFYGEFGLGLTREWAETNGLNPVLYIAGSNQVAEAFREVSNHAGHLPDDKINAAFNTARYLLAHAKPTSGKVLINGEPVEKVFYQESEWRYVPRLPEFPDYLSRSDFQISAKLNEKNNLTKCHAMLKYNPRDIRYIFVKSDSDIPEVINFIFTQLGHLLVSDQKILMSRVVSLESLSDDL